MPGQTRFRWSDAQPYTKEPAGAPASGKDGRAPDPPTSEFPAEPAPGPRPAGFAADDILLQVTPRLPIGDVWQGLVRPEHLEKWLAPRVRLEPRVGGAFELFWDLEDPSRNSTEGCRVLRFKEPEEMAFTWKGPPRFAALMNAEGVRATEVYLRVAPCPEGIDVTLEHKGWGTGEAWEEARSWHFRYWDDTLHAYLDYMMTEKAPAPPRRE